MCVSHCRIEDLMTMIHEEMEKIGERVTSMEDI